MFLALLLAAQVAVPVTGGWAEEDAVASRALAIRARALEEATGFRFTAVPVAHWERPDSPGFMAGGQYVTETGEVLLSVAIMYQLNVDFLPTPMRLLAPAAVAANPKFSEIADHELGHALADQVSQRAGRGAWYTNEAFSRMSREHQLGLNIVAEGIGQFFGGQGKTTPDTKGQELFPTATDVSWYPFHLVAYGGGAWLVHDILKLHGERGLVWLVTHPLSAGTDMRADAVAYRTRALAELTGPTH